MKPMKPVDMLAAAFRGTNDVILRTFEDLSDEAFRWRARETGSSLGFIFWHIGRWTDYFQASLAGEDGGFESPPPPGTQIWEREALGARWGFGDARLGLHDTGTHADEAELERLPWPDKTTLIDYVRRTFAAADDAVGKIGEHNFQQPQNHARDAASASTIGNSLVEMLAHNIHHLGEIHCMLDLRRAALAPTQT